MDAWRCACGASGSRLAEWVAHGAGFAGQHTLVALVEDTAATVEGALERERSHWFPWWRHHQHHGRHLVSGRLVLTLEVGMTDTGTPTTTFGLDVVWTDDQGNDHTTGVPTTFQSSNPSVIDVANATDQHCDLALADAGVTDATQVSIQAFFESDDGTSHAGPSQVFEVAPVTPPPPPPPPPGGTIVSGRLTVSGTLPANVTAVPGGTSAVQSGVAAAPAAPAPAAPAAPAAPPSPPAPPPATPDTVGTGGAEQPPAPQDPALPAS